jgi:hypothetical protein
MSTMGRKRTFGLLPNSFIENMCSLVHRPLPRSAGEIFCTFAATCRSIRVRKSSHGRESPARTGRGCQLNYWRNIGLAASAVVVLGTNLRVDAAVASGRHGAVRPLEELSYRPVGKLIYLPVRINGGA